MGRSRCRLRIISKKYTRRDWCGPAISPDMTRETAEKIHSEFHLWNWVATMLGHHLIDWHLAGGWRCETGLFALRYGSHSVTCKLHRTCLYLVSIHQMAHPDWGCGHLIASYYSFIYPERMKGWVGLGGWLRNETVYLPEGSHSSQY